MGADGGSIPTRCELVKMKKAPEKLDQTEVNRVKFAVCAISKEPLREPIVACPLGSVLNKESVLKGLIEKSLPDEFLHIKSIKDVVELHFTPNPAYTKEATIADAASDTAARFVCSITGLQTTGRYGFSALLNCGCVFSNRALDEIPASECVNCHTPYSDDDVLPLNGSDDQIANLQAKLEERRKSEKKRPKKDKRRKRKSREQKEKAKETEKVSLTKKARARHSKKRTKAEPEVAQSEAYKSIFISSAKSTPAVGRETFLCRNVRRT